MHNRDESRVEISLVISSDPSLDDFPEESKGGDEYLQGSDFCRCGRWQETVTPAGFMDFLSVVMALRWKSLIGSGRWWVEGGYVVF